MARLYGFGHRLTETQGWTQTIILLLVFAVMAVPLALSLVRIGSETVTTSKIRTFLTDQFGSNARVTQLDVDYDQTPMIVRAVVIAPQRAAHDTKTVEREMRDQLHRPLRLRLDQVLLDPAAGSIETQKAELRQTSDAADAEDAAAAAVKQAVALVAGVSQDEVTIDRDHRRAAAKAATLPGATPTAYRTLEQRAAGVAHGWEVQIIPPLGQLPPITFPSASATPNDDTQRAIDLAIWEARRWNVLTISVSGLANRSPIHPSLAQRRAAVVAKNLQKSGLSTISGPAIGSDTIIL